MTIRVENLRKTFPDPTRTGGRFVAVDSVEVRARVSGYLQSVLFTDGQTVKQGDLLFSIDRRPFQNTLEQVRANLTQARSNLIYAESDLARGQQLVRERTIAEQVRRETMTKQVGVNVRLQARMARPRLHNLPNTGGGELCSPG